MTTMSINPTAHVLHPDFGKRQRVFTYPRDLTDIVIEANEMRMARHAKRSEHLEQFVGTEDYFTEMMNYDLELAPNVTGRELLLCHGIVPVPPQELKSPSSCTMNCGPSSRHWPSTVSSSSTLTTCRTVNCTPACTTRSSTRVPVRYPRRISAASS
jgi:hypothetical protein